MRDCSIHQGRLLDHLYGLLEDQETQALLAHLATCPECQVALEQAHRQKNLLARAALLSFPEVSFTPPEEEPASIPLPTRTPTRRGWIRWAGAAVVLLCLGGLTFPILRFQEKSTQLRSAVARDEATIQRAKNAVEIASAKTRNLPVEIEKKRQEARLAAEARRLNVFVSGPGQIPVGAQSDYHISTRDLRGQAASARLDVRLVDNSGRVVHEEKDVPTRGEHRLRLPANLDVRGSTLLALEVAARREGDNDPLGVLRERIELTSSDFVTHLTTDKPIYRPGEIVRFRSLTLERFSLRPPERDFHLIYAIRLPTGESREFLEGRSRVTSNESLPTEVSGPDGKPVRGIGTGEWWIHPDAPAGEYTLTIREKDKRFVAQSRKFFVHRYEPGPFRKELVFDRASYGPGEKGRLHCRVLNPDGTPLAGVRVRPTVHIDNIAYGSDGKPGSTSEEKTTDARGEASLSFQLPAQIRVGRGSITVRFEKGESDLLLRPIPLALNSLQVDFFPEGGDLVAGLPNRVYFQVRTSQDRPADLRGRIVDDQGREVAQVRTLRDAVLPGVNRGMGEFTFTPEAGRTYQLKVDEPRGIASTPGLPTVRSEGVVLYVPQGVVSADQPVSVGLKASGGDRSFLVGLYCRGRLLAQETLTVKKGEKGELRLRPEGSIGGVCRLTVFEDRGVREGRQRELIPVAERLIYRDVASRLKIEVQADQTAYQPGDKATLTVTTRDEADRPVGAVVLLRVVDRRTLALANDTTARSLPTHFLLTQEVRRAEDLEHADFLLTDHPQARTVLDFLLGTQGWRRFAEQDPLKFRRDHGAEAERVLASAGTTTTNFLERELARLQVQQQKQSEELEAEEREALAAYLALLQDGEILRRAEQFWFYEDLRFVVWRWSMPVLAALVALVVLVGFLSGIVRTVRRAVPLSVGVAVCVVLLAFLASHNVTLQEQREIALQARDRSRWVPIHPEFAKSNGVPVPGAGFPAGNGQVGVASVNPRPPRNGVRIPMPPNLDLPHPVGPKPADPADAVMPEEAIIGKGGADILNPLELPPPPPPLPLREYAHTHLKGNGPDFSSDATDLLLWRPVFIVPGEGKATATLELSDSVTSFEVTIWGHTLDGRLGATTSGIESRK